MCIVENELGHLTPFAVLTMESFQTAQAVSARHEWSCFQGIGCIESHKGYSLWELWIQQISAKGQKKNATLTKPGVQHSTISHRLPSGKLAHVLSEANPPNQRQQGGKGSDRVRPRPHDSATGNPKTTARLSIQQRAVARMPRTVNEKLSREEEPALFRGGGINRIPIKRCTIWNMRRD